MKKEHSCNALKALKIIRIILSIILLSYTLSLCIIGHCASDQYYFPMSQNENSHFSDDCITAIETAFHSDDNFIFAKYTNFYDNSIYFYVMVFPKSDDYMVFGEIFNNAYEFSMYSVGSTSNAGYAYCRYSVNEGVVWVGPSNFGAFSNLISSSYDNNRSYVSNFQIYTNNTDSKKIVLLYDDSETIPEGDTAREDMEKPDISDYIPNWTNTPTFDSSSVENALQSVYNGIVWLGSNIKDTITGTGEYMADTVRWSIQKVLKTIREVFTAIEGKINEVKTAILTVVDKIQTTFDYISQPYDSTKVNTAFNNMAIKTDYNNMTTVVNNAFSVFDSTSEPMTFKIPVHLENIPILHINTVQFIDLGWLYDSRSIIRTFMWCVTTFSLLYTIIDALPSYLQGNDE